MNKLAIVLVVLCACRSSDKAEAPMEAPSLSADGKLKVPPGYETTFTFDGKPTRLEYTWLEVLSYESKPALRVLAQGGPHHGMLTIPVPIADGTHKLDQMVGIDIGAFPDGISFGNAPVMATGTGGTIKISEVTPQYVSGTFQAQACEMGQRTCAQPMQVTNGAFKAFRSALSDDAAFSRYAK
jgi:hypothetical protein